jgi:hypothetical protein
LNQSPPRSDAQLSAGDPRWCAVVAVCKNLLEKNIIWVDLMKDKNSLFAHAHGMHHMQHAVTKLEVL